MCTLDTCHFRQAHRPWESGCFFHHTQAIGGQAHARAPDELVPGYKEEPF